MPRVDDPTSEVTITAVDVGSVANIGWWAEPPSGPASGRDLDSLVECVASELTSARSVALGCEAPLYVPLSHGVIVTDCPFENGEVEGRFGGPLLGPSALAAQYRRAERYARERFPRGFQPRGVRATGWATG